MWSFSKMSKSSRWSINLDVWRRIHEVSKGWKNGPKLTINIYIKWAWFKTMNTKLSTVRALMSLTPKAESRDGDRAEHWGTRQGFAHRTAPIWHNFLPTLSITKMSGEPGRSGSWASGVQGKVKARGLLNSEELMLLNCGVGGDSWESLGLQGVRTGPS